MKIIDISHYNRVTNWTAVKNAVDMVIIKASQGHALTSNAAFFEDRTFREYIEAAISVGIPVGAYHFFTGRTAADTAAEAEFFAAALEPYKPYIKLAVCDAENYGNKWLLGLSKKQLSDNITRFCRAMEAEGYRAAHYTNTDHLSRFIDASAIPYPVWQADYVRKDKPTTARLIAWQYSDEGSVPGIVGGVDVSHGYLADAPAVTAYCVGDTYVIKPGDVYSNGKAVPARLIGKRYTVSAVREGRVLLREIMSWVRV